MTKCIEIKSEYCRNLGIHLNFPSETLFLSESVQILESKLLGDFQNPKQKSDFMWQERQPERAIIASGASSCWWPKLPAEIRFEKPTLFLSFHHRNIIYPRISAAMKCKAKTIPVKIFEVRVFAFYIKLHSSTEK